MISSYDHMIIRAYVQLGFFDGHSYNMNLRSHFGSSSLLFKLLALEEQGLRDGIITLWMKNGFVRDEPEGSTEVREARQGICGQESIACRPVAVVLMLRAG